MKHLIRAVVEEGGCAFHYTVDATGEKPIRSGQVLVIAMPDLTLKLAYAVGKSFTVDAETAEMICDRTGFDELPTCMQALEIFTE